MPGEVRKLQLVEQLGGINIVDNLCYKQKPKTQITIYSKRRYGEPRLIKPKEINNIKQAFSIDWILKKCRCPCFIYNNDLYIKHRDFGSIDVYNSGHKFKSKFIYNDNFGCVVLRGEAWILLKDFILDIKNNVFEPTLFACLSEQITGEIGNCEWERFFERVIQTAKCVLEVNKIN